jgi:hypothetical protein
VFDEAIRAALNKPKPKKSGGCVLLWELYYGPKRTLHFHFLLKMETRERD